MCRKYFGFLGKIAIVFAIMPLCFCLWGTNTNSKAAFAEQKSGCIVMNANTFEVIYGENVHERLPMASTTKVMTALLIIENCNLDEIVTIDKRAIGVEGSSVYLREGEKLTVKELLYCLMLRSGNDSAVALALHLCNNIEDFAEMMNIKAEMLGLKNTHFVNPHGLHDENHYTSCYDLCFIGCTAMHNPYFREIVSTKVVTVGTGESTRYLTNKNKTLNMYEHSNGIKTGYTKTAGRCLVASAEKSDVQVVSVVLNRPDMYNECCALMDRAFNKLLNENT